MVSCGPSCIVGRYSGRGLCSVGGMPLSVAVYKDGLQRIDSTQTERSIRESRVFLPELS